MMGGGLWMVSHHLHVPGRQWLVYVCVAFLSTTCTCVVSRLPGDFTAYLLMSEDELAMVEDAAAVNEDSCRERETSDG